MDYSLAGNNVLKDHRWPILCGFCKGWACDTPSLVALADARSPESSSHRCSRGGRKKKRPHPKRPAIGNAHPLPTRKGWATLICARLKGCATRVVFKTDVKVNTGNWKAAEAAVKAHGDTFTMLSGDKATVAAWNKAISKPDTHAIFVGHTSHDMNADGSIGKTNGIVLNDGRSAGQVGSESYKMTPGANPGDPQASAVALPSEDRK